MKLGGTTDIKFVRPKQTRHLFCLGRFCILGTCIPRPGIWIHLSQQCQAAELFLLYMPFVLIIILWLASHGECIDFQIFCFVDSNSATGRCGKA